MRAGGGDGELENAWLLWGMAGWLGKLLQLCPQQEGAHRANALSMVTILYLAAFCIQHSANCILNPAFACRWRTYEGHRGAKPASSRAQGRHTSRQKLKVCHQCLHFKFHSWLAVHFALHTDVLDRMAGILDCGPAALAVSALLCTTLNENLIFLLCVRFKHS